MTSARIHSLQALAAAILLAVSAASHAVVYKWVEEDGRVIYSNEPPPDRSKVRELTRIDDLEIAPADRRDSLSTDREKRSIPSAVATPLPTAPSAEPVTLIPRQPVTLLPREPVALSPSESGSAPRETETQPPRVYPRSRHTGAVQDPCLMSSNPRCHERNKGNYHPFLGYSPAGSALQPVGLTSSTAGGSVGAQVPAPQSAVVPQPQKRGAQALPPGTAAIEWTKPVR